MRKMIVNLLLSLASVLLVYLLAEFVAFPLVLDRLPASLYTYMPREMRLAGQTSKQGRLPAPGYLALAGDSYAQGKGDWFIENGYDRSSRYQATHLLQDALGVDAVTFGRSGASSFDGLVLEPLQILRRFERLGMELADPSAMLLFFYEGNDVYDNRRFLGDMVDETGWERPRSAEQYRRFLERLEAAYADGGPREPGDDLLFGNLIVRLLRDRVYYPLTRKIVDPDPLRAPGEVNRVVLDSGIVPVPDTLQGPPVEQNPRSVDDALTMFEQCCLHLRTRLPDTELFIVYVPAPLSCYSWDGGRVSQYRNEAPVPAREVMRLSQAMAGRLRAFARAEGFGFADPRPALRAEAAHTLLHGPRDWDHFNRAGYEAFTRAVLDEIGPQLRAATEK